MHKYMYGAPYVKTTSNDILAGCRVNILPSGEYTSVLSLLLKDIKYKILQKTEAYLTTFILADRKSHLSKSYIEYRLS